jgi:hypothetical protein
MLYSYFASDAGTTREEAEAIRDREIEKRVALGFARPTGEIVPKRVGGGRHCLRGNLMTWKPSTRYLVKITGDV